MAKERLKNVTIPVYTQQTLDRLNQLFPEGFSKEETLNAFLDKAAAPEPNEQHQEQLTSLHTPMSGPTLKIQISPHPTYYIIFASV